MDEERNEENPQAKEVEDALKRCERARSGFRVPVNIPEDPNDYEACQDIGRVGRQELLVLG